MIGDDNHPVDNAQSTAPKTPDNVSATQTTEPSAATPTEERPRRRRGFAAMDRERVREIASKGGKAAHSAGTAHQFSSDEARVAGRKGGMAPHVRRGGVRRRTTSESAPAPVSAPRDSSNDGRQ
ncbi:MAG: hypothetical protein JST00_00300 [Deltaproteobacteria bacterium]|nr:hypothetical protein [Deltaproteobacteria bacterium]